MLYFYDMETSPKTESLTQLVQEVEKSVVALPEFQRDFVWEIGKSYDLFDSLVKGIFVGSIIYGKPAFGITVRELDKRPRRGKGSRAKLSVISFTEEQVKQKANVDNFRLILDGQQRVTSIVRALKGIDNVWFICKTQQELLEEFGNNNHDELGLESLLYQFAGDQRPDRLSINLANVYATVEKTFRESKIKEEHFEVLDHTKNPDIDSEQEFDIYLSIQNKLADFFKAETLLSYYLLNTNSEKFALFFERSNSKGIQLNFIDVLAAKLYIGFNLREKINEFEEEHKNYQLSREAIVRAIAFLEGSGKVDRGYILKTLDHRHFDRYWDDVTAHYRRCLDFLYDNRWIVSQNWIPYPNMLIPLIAFLNSLGSDFSQMTQNQRDDLEAWYWCSIFAERYSVNSNEVVSKDSKFLARMAKGQQLDDRALIYELRPKIERADDLLSVTQKGSALYKGTLNFINYKTDGLKDWKNTSRLSFNSDIHDHHIYPKQYIADLHGKDSVESGLVDSVVNRTLIPKITNIKIGKKSPSDYMKQLQKDNSNLSRSLESHLIPHSEGLLSGDMDQKFPEFMEERSEKIFSLIKADVIEKYEALRKNP